MDPLRRLVWMAPFAAAVAAQRPRTPEEEHAPRMKQSQMEELLKEEHRKSIEDAGKIVELSEALKAEMEKNDRHVLSVSVLKKTEEIEKLAKRIRSRMRRF